MARALALAAAAVCVCFLCSCVGKFSLIDHYYATPPEGESKVVEKETLVEERVSQSPQFLGSESAVEVVEEPLK